MFPLSDVYDVYSNTADEFTAEQIIDREEMSHTVKCCVMVQKDLQGCVLISRRAKSNHRSSDYFFMWGAFIDFFVQIMYKQSTQANVLKTNFVY